jgi:hypothetical protein
MVATGVVFFPAAPLFLFMHGKDIVIPKGTEITAYINGDMRLDQAKFAPKGPEAPQPAASSATTPAQPEPSTVVVKSTPEGADITVDGKYVGSSPSTVRLSAGDHTVLIEKAGFKPWQRAMTASAGGNVTIDATLDKVQ